MYVIWIHIRMLFVLLDRCWDGRTLFLPLFSVICINNSLPEVAMANPLLGWNHRRWMIVTRRHTALRMFTKKKTLMSCDTDAEPSDASLLSLWGNLGEHVHLAGSGCRMVIWDKSEAPQKCWKLFTVVPSKYRYCIFLLYTVMFLIQIESELYIRYG